MSNTIQPQDLRIGNLIKIDGIVLRVDARTIFDFENDGRVKEPIPLTEEILVKAGFDYYNDQHECLIKDCWCKGARSELFYYPKEEFKLILKSRYEEDYGKSRHLQSLPHIEYLHQLQNLFHSLTGRELEINYK